MGRSEDVWRNSIRPCSLRFGKRRYLLQQEGMDRRRHHNNAQDSRRIHRWLKEDQGKVPRCNSLLHKLQGSKLDSFTVVKPCCSFFGQPQLWNRPYRKQGRLLHRRQALLQRIQADVRYIFRFYSYRGRPDELRLGRLKADDCKGRSCYNDNGFMGSFTVPADR